MNAFYIIYITNSLGGSPIGDDGLHALSLPIKNYCKELKELELVNIGFLIILILLSIDITMEFSKHYLRMENFSDNNINIFCAYPVDFWEHSSLIGVSHV